MNIIEIQKEFVIEQNGKKIILEKGDRIEVLKESWTEEGGDYGEAPYLYSESGNVSLEIFKLSKAVFLAQLSKNGKESNKKISGIQKMIDFANKEGLSGLTSDLLENLALVV